MKKKVSAKIQKKLDNIIKLKSELENWEKLSEEEVLKYVKEFEKTPRDEGSSFYNDIFTDDEFAEILLDISQEYVLNTKMNVYIISSLGNMMERYKLNETNNIYEYFLSNIHKKGVSVYVSLFFTEMHNFSNYIDKWDYIMSVKDMKPAKIGESSFETIIKREVANMPNEHKSIINKHFIEKSKTANNEGGKKYYLELAEEFNLD